MGFNLGQEFKEITEFLFSVGFGKVANTNSIALDRRNKWDTVKEVQFLVLDSFFKNISPILENHPSITQYWPARNNLMGFWWKDFLMVRITLCQTHNWGSHLLYQTSSDRFINLMVERAQSIGMQLTRDNGLVFDQLQIAGPVEEEIFHVLGLIYIEPDARSGISRLIPRAGESHKEFNISSDSGLTNYKIYSVGKDWHCTHPRWKPGQECKHIKAAQKLLNPNEYSKLKERINDF